jgi:hypothetical protein
MSVVLYSIGGLFATDGPHQGIVPGHHCFSLFGLHLLL